MCVYIYSSSAACNRRYLPKRTISSLGSGYGVRCVLRGANESYVRIIFDLYGNIQIYYMYVIIVVGQHKSTTPTFEIDRLQRASSTSTSTPHHHYKSTPPCPRICTFAAFIYYAKQFKNMQYNMLSCGEYIRTTHIKYFTQKRSKYDYKNLNTVPTHARREKARVEHDWFTFVLFGDTIAHVCRKG